MGSNKVKGLFVGDIFNQKHGELEVIEYKGAREVVVKFIKTGTIRTTSVGHIKSGSVSDPMFPTLYDFGFMGIGNYRPATHREIYEDWQCMIARCYSVARRKSLIVYEDCSVHQSWANFQIFAEWAENQTERLNKGWCLDKDILVKDNREYGPLTCSYIPVEINMILCNLRGKDKAGASFHNHSGKWRADFQDETGKRRVKYFETQEQALDHYKVNKEIYIKRVANKYKGIVSEKVYNALISYEVNKND